MTALVSAYCACGMFAACPSGTLTASCDVPVAGITVAAPRSVPLGSVVQITLANGQTLRRIVQDRTHRRFDGRFDIFMASHAEAMRFGLQRAEIQIFLPGTHDTQPTSETPRRPAVNQRTDRVTHRTGAAPGVGQAAQFLGVNRGAPTTPGTAGTWVGSRPLFPRTSARNLRPLHTSGGARRNPTTPATGASRRTSTFPR